MARTELVVALGDRLYSVERPWEILPDEMRLRLPGHVAVDSQDNLYVYQRSDPPVVVLDPSGELVRSWGTGVISDAHGIFITPDDLVLVVDRDAHQVLGFDPDGRLEFTLGERHRPSFQAPFNHPTGVAVAPNGDIYVTDGYGNSAVHCFGRDGGWIHSWGRPGTGPGEFSTPHAVWVDELNRVLVADRENNRVQLFDADGKYITEWGDLYHPMDIYAGPDGMVYVTDQTPRLSMFAPDGTLVGRCRPVLNGAHGIWGDSRGNLYLAELAPENRVTRLTPRNEAEGTIEA
jgi:DNA-binding beta-propeller fold protein YncE